MQLVDLRLGSINDAWNWNRGALIYYYGTAARDSWNAFANSPDNNGNVLRQVNYVPLVGGGYVHPQLDDYSYDSLNRITSVTEAQLDSGGNWTFNLFKQNYDYDRWGNRTVWCSPGQPGVTCDTFTIDAATNRITAKNGYPMTYDSAGNQTNDVTGSRWFDGENRMYKAQQGGTTSHYVYDADGKRVRRIVGTTETWQVYGMEGELIAEYNANGSTSSPQKEYGYRNGQMLIVAQASPLEVRWLVTDHLGTPRMNIRGTGADGGSLTSVTRHDYLPFGEELIAGIRRNGSNGQYGYEPPPDGVRQKFGSKERDNETGLDYFEARYFSSTQGRFTSPDEFTGGPVESFAVAASTNPTIYSDPTRPQSLNKYQYCYNNPLRYIDSNGHEPYDSDPQKGEAIKINQTGGPIIISAESKLIDRVPKTGEVPVGGEFEIKYKYAINDPATVSDGKKPGDYGSVEPIGKNGTFTNVNQVGLVKMDVQVDKTKEGVTVTKTERYMVNGSDRGGSSAINFRIVVKDPVNTDKTAVLPSTTTKTLFGDKRPLYIPVRNVPKESVQPKPKKRNGEE